MGHGKTTGAVCDPKAFDGVVIVEPGILGPRNGSVGVDLVASGYGCQRRRENASAGRSKIASRTDGQTAPRGRLFSCSLLMWVAVTSRVKRRGPTSTGTATATRPGFAT